MLTKSVLLASVAVLGILSVAQSAQAMELWDPHLRGSDEGMAAGAALPPGVYGVMHNYWAAYDQFGPGGHKTGNKLDVLVEVPVVLWQTGYQIFGADLSMAVAQPFDYTNFKSPNTASLSDNAHWGTFNTIFIPFQLSWTLPENFHVATNLTVYADDATSSPADPPGGGGIGSGNGFWTLEPSLGVSWLQDGWNLSISAHYDYNFKNHKTDYHSGQQIAVDYTVAKTIGKWTFGVGAHQENQLTNDSGSGAVGCAAKKGCKVVNSGIGPLIGYQFDTMALQLTYNQNIYAQNDVAGTILNLRLVTALN